MTTSAKEILASLRGLRQSRRFLPDAIRHEDLAELVEVARWTGSAKNSQPWHLVVVTDPQVNAALAGYGAFTAFLEGSAASIVVALEGEGRSVPYDDGRLQERVMLAAAALGIGSGTAWFSSGESRQRVRDLLGIPAHLEPWSAIGLGTRARDTASSDVRASLNPSASRYGPAPSTWAVRCSGVELGSLRRCRSRGSVRSQWRRLSCRRVRFER